MADLSPERYHKLRVDMAVVQALKDELRRCTMIYQYDEKTRAARFLGIDPEDLYEMAYDDWAKIRSEYNRRLDETNS
jgi:hypothetical protein